jgi:hypothetical protein
MKEKKDLKLHIEKYILKGHLCKNEKETCSFLNQECSNDGCHLFFCEIIDYKKYYKCVYFFGE